MIISLPDIKTKSANEWVFAAFDFSKVQSLSRSKYGELVLAGPNFTSNVTTIAKAEPALKAELQKAWLNPPFGESPLKPKPGNGINVGSSVPVPLVNDLLARAASSGCFKPVKL